MEELHEQQCAPCRGGTPPMTAAEAEEFAQDLDGWSVVETHHLAKKFEFPDFKSALEFVNEVGEVAETEDHHPDIWFTWGKAEIEIRTHKIDGLSKNDFILAAKIDQLGR